MRRPKTVATLGLLLCALSSSAFGASKLKVTNTTWGWNPLTESVPTGSTPESQFPSVAVNQPIQINFSEKLAKKSIKDSTVFITSIGANVLNPLGLSSSLPGGLRAPVSLKVKRGKLQILPAQFFVGSTVSFGFAPNAYYYLEIRGRNKGIKGTDGSRLKRSVIIGFRTTDVVADPSPGPPNAKVTLIDMNEGRVKLTETEPAFPVSSFGKASTSPPPTLLIEFNELVIPSTLTNPSTGESDALELKLDLDNINTTFVDRVTMPGFYEVSHTSTRTLAEWVSVLPNFPADSLYLLEVAPTVEDIVGNSRFKESGDIGDVQLFAYRTVDTPSEPLDPLVEPFNNRVFADTDLTSADWANTDPGFLKQGVGGGTGEDGPLRPTENMSLSTEVFDTDLGEFVQKTWNFTLVDIPEGVTVRVEGRFPLKILVTGSFKVAGTLDLSGGNGEQFNEQRIRPGAGGLGVAGGGSGGLGGSMTDGVDLDSPLFASAGLPGYPAPLLPNQGLTGLSSLIEPWTLTKGSGVAITEAYPGLWLQPNTGTGSVVPGATPGDAINHNHPTFRITDILLPSEIDVVSSPQADDYFGSLNQPGLDIYELPPPPIAKAGDPYVVGDMAGHAGESVAFPGGAGLGSLPLTVAQSLVTEVRSGGGGGGGGRSPGVKGEDSPRAGLGDQNSGTDGGLGGGGFLSGPVVSRTANVVTTSGTPFQGLDLAGDADNPPFVIYPNATSGFAFEIASHTANTVTVKVFNLPLTSGVDTDLNGTYDLNDVPAGGNFRIEPGYNRGGNGAGGSGVHLAGTVKLPGPPNLTMPTWTPGAGGGAGGGAGSVEAGGRIEILSTGLITASGGDGGRTTGAIGASASGGGGGSGGGVLLASADPTITAVRIEGRVEAVGGEGGIGFVEGGQGGAGRIRFESLSNNVNPSQFPPGAVAPPVQATDLGYMIPGLTPSLGQSKFYFSQSFLPKYDNFTVTYNARVDGVDMVGLTYGTVDLDAGREAPFDLSFNDAGMTSAGLVDQDTVDAVFEPGVDGLTLPFVRFRLGLFPERIVDGAVITRVSIDSIEIEVSG